MIDGKTPPKNVPEVEPSQQIGMGSLALGGVQFMTSLPRADGPTGESRHPGHSGRCDRSGNAHRGGTGEVPIVARPYKEGMRPTQPGRGGTSCRMPTAACRCACAQRIFVLCLTVCAHDGTNIRS